MTLTSASDKKVYDGTPLTNSTVNVTDDGFATGEGATYDVTGSQLNVDKSENTFTDTLNEGTKAKNYEIETEFGKLEVTPVTDKVTVTICGQNEDGNLRRRGAYRFRLRRGEQQSAVYRKLL